MSDPLLQAIEQASPTAEKVANTAGYAQDGQGMRRVARNAWGSRQAAYKYLKGAGGLGLALGGIEGAAKSMGDSFNGGREEWFDQMGFDESRMNRAEITLADALRTLGDVGNATTYNGAQWLGERLPEPEQITQSLDALGKKFLHYAMKPGQDRSRNTP